MQYPDILIGYSRPYTFSTPLPLWKKRSRPVTCFEFYSL